MRRSAPQLIVAPKITAAALLAVWAAGCGARESQPLPATIQWVVRGHQEIALTEPVTPVFIGAEPAVGLCLQAPATLDTSLWEARLTLDGRSLTEEAAGPRVAMGPTVCFRAEVPPAFLLAPGEAPQNALLGGILRDRFDGTTYELPKLSVRFVPDGTAFEALEKDAAEALSRIGGEADPWDIVARIDALEQRARQEGAPLLAVRLVLASTFTLDRLGTEVALAEVERRLSSLPAWLDDSAASGWATHAAYARASLALHNRRLQEAWGHLRRTEELQLRTANFNHLSTIHLQASIRAQVGTPREAASSLRTALDDCRKWPCNEKMLPELRSSLAWLTALDPLAGSEELRLAEEAVAAARDSAGNDASPTRLANYLLNSAVLDARQERDPMGSLDQARDILASLPVSDRDLQLEGWSTVIEAQWHLAAGRPRDALKLCRQVIGSAIGPFGEAEAWARGCVGRGLRALGDLEGAAEALNAALLLHETMAAEPLGQSIPLGPGRRAEDYYAAARVQVELGRPAAAWELLSLLDQTSTEGIGGGDCEGPRGDLGERDALLEELRALEGPASGARRRQREPVQRSLRARLQEIWRSQRRCSPEIVPEEQGHGGLHLRAFALADEVILLQQNAGGAVRTAHRSAIERSDLLRSLEEAATLMEARQPLEAPGTAWEDTLAPLAQVLLPRDLDTLPPVITFSLYGPLQGAPLAALPLTAHGEPHQLLLDATIPVVRPAARGPTAPGEQGHPVFVVDPREDLDGGALASFYRQVFPHSKILEGAEATGEALFQALDHAAWLHVDAHGSTDSAFPELSSLLLADRPVTFLELADLRRRLLLANLSGCKTGRWPVTADSGRYGIGGLLASRSARWVIASRADLDNRMAEDFNRAFYERLAQGDGVPRAYGTALRQLRKNYPVRAWAAFLLLSSQSGGQSQDEVTPVLVGARLSPHQPPGELDRTMTDTGGRG